MADRYVPFPPFAEWAGLSVDDDAFRQFVSLLAADRETAPPEVLDRAVRIATRYAAVDTGAIEGLYQTDRGFTKTVALETAA